MHLKHIVIDNRISGSSTGRYSDKLTEYLYKQNANYNITIITTPERKQYIKKIAPSFNIVCVNYKNFSLGEQIGFWWTLKKLNPDLVFFSMVQQPLLYGGKTVTMMHDLTALTYKNNYQNHTIQAIKQWLYNLLNHSVAKKSTAILTPSIFIKNTLVKKYKISKEKVTVTYEAADKITLKAKPVDKLINKTFLLYVGRAQSHKNLARLIKSFAKLKNNNPKLYLVLAGKLDSSYEQIIQSTDNSLLKNTIFTGFIKDSQLRWLYENAQAYVFPSLSEGFGLPGLEAMAHNCPVVSSNSTCLPEVYGEAAHYFDPTNINDMAKKIDDVLSNNKLRRKLITNGQKQLKKYSWEKTAQETLEVYRQVLEDN